MTVSDKGMFIFQWFCLSLLMVAAAVIRTPGRLRSFGLLILCVYFLLLGPGIVYGFNLAISGPAEHSPAEVVEYSWPIAGEENGEYSLTVRLDDGSRIELEVSERLYKLERSGQELELCQRPSPLGLRFVALHMPGRPGLGDGGL